MGTTNDPLVSVLMPAFNTEAYLSAAVESILGQTLSDFEFIIVDDGSTDATWNIAESYAIKDQRIRLARNESNQGMAYSLNRGLSLARGRFVARMDADDISIPRRLELQVAFLDLHPEVGVLGAAVQVVGPDGSRKEIVRFPKDHGVLRWIQCFHTPLPHPTVMMRRQIVAKVAGYRSDYEPADDRDLWQRISSITRIANLDDVLLLYRKHRSSVSQRESETQIRNSARVIQRALAEALQKDVPFELCRYIRCWTFENDADAWAASRLVIELYRTFAADPSLSALEKRIIRRDAARRLFGLAWNRRADPRARLFLLEALRLDASLIAIHIGRKAGAKLGTWLFRRVP